MTLKITAIAALRDFVLGLPVDYTDLTQDACINNPLQDGIVKQSTEDGIKACLIGHGPAAGLEITSFVDDYDPADIKINWKGYSFTTFGLIEGSTDWEYAFGSFWYDDNEFAAQRLTDLLSEPFGAPDWFIQNESTLYNLPPTALRDFVEAIS